MDALIAVETGASHDGWDGFIGVEDERTTWPMIATRVNGRR
jgi:hypothetical protein